MLVFNWSIISVSLSSPELHWYRCREEPLLPFRRPLRPEQSAGPSVPGDSLEKVGQFNLQFIEISSVLEMRGVVKNRKNKWTRTSSQFDYSFMTKQNIFLVTSALTDIGPFYISVKLDNHPAYRKWLLQLSHELMLKTLDNVWLDKEPGQRTVVVVVVQGHKPTDAGNTNDLLSKICSSLVLLVRDKYSGV